MKTEEIQAALFDQRLKDGSDLVRQLMTLATGVCAALFTQVDKAHRADCGIWLWGFAELCFAASVACCYVTMLLDKEMVSNQLGEASRTTAKGIKAAHSLSGRIVCSERVSMILFIAGGLLSGWFAIVTREI